MIRCSQIIAVVDGLSLRRDGQFDGLGYLGHRQETTSEMLFLSDKRYLPKLLARSGVSCVLTSTELAGELPRKYGVIEHVDPAFAFFQLHEALLRDTDFYGTSRASQIDGSAFIHPSAIVADTGVCIESGVWLGENVVIHSKTRIGANSVIRAGSIIGSEGFEFKRFSNRWVRVNHAGGVTIGVNCEIQSLCAVDRALFGGQTIIGDGCKLDNFVHIAHGVRVGNNCLLAASAMVAGAVTIGDNVRVDPNCSIGHEVTIGNGAYISIGAVVCADVLPGQRVTGNFAVEHSAFLKFWSKLRTGRLFKS